ncbi:hypothetical protein ABMA28_010587 [Loxostege sticticalis]|uniref:Peptidase S1 domain-containing protein n=1 Tax=Loxostege sticticalis TaxID=481309 RepID=A0ABD0SAW5_LOXSC
MHNLLCVVLLAAGTSGHSDSWLSDDNEIQFIELLSSFDTRRSQLNLDQTYLSSLENYQVEAVPATEAQYPWIARVVHSRTLDIPHMCTAACIEERIFITAARCIYSLKVHYTTLIYQHTRLPVRAFVLPSKGTKQAFDDIGFIVVEDVSHGHWATVKLYDETNRTDDGFNWFTDRFGSAQSGSHKVVGYATQKGIPLTQAPDRLFELTEIPVVVHIVSIHMDGDNGFHVPCYHSCTLKQFKTNSNDPNCKKYHGVEGGAVLNTKTNKLLGLATWGMAWEMESMLFPEYELPVGFAVPNSANFFNDYVCARRIRDDDGEPGMSYQRLCVDDLT